MGISQTFIDGFCEGFRPMRKALPVLLTGAVAMTLLLLAGVGLLLVSRSVDPPLDVMTRIMGEVLMVAGGLAGVVTTVWAWWRMFNAAGILGKQP